MQTNLSKENVFDGMHHPFGIDQLQLYRKMSFERDLLLRFIRRISFVLDYLRMML
jgi:hypothetical protein